ncbi:MAG: hypothetical protein ACK58N_17055 [Synechocystis sp.]
MVGYSGFKLFTNSDCWLCYGCLPEKVQKRADRAYELLRQNPRYPSLHLKKTEMAIAYNQVDCLRHWL